MKIKMTKNNNKVYLTFTNNKQKSITVTLSEEEYEKAFGSRGLSLNKYQEKAKSTCTDNSYSYSYLSAGLIEEVGEFFGKIAKMVRKGELPQNFTREDILALPDEKREALMKEGGDMSWFLAVLLDWFGWSFEQVGNGNLEKLADRQKRGVIVGEGDNR